MINSKSNKRKSSGGYALLELLFYISFFAAMAFAVISSLITMSGSFRETSLYASLAQSSSIMERITRDIRNAESVASVGSGSLTLNTRDEAGNPKTVQFVLAGTDVELRENNSLVGDLDSVNIAVDNLSFTSITTSESTAIKIEMSVRAISDTQGRTFDFYDTVVLRGAY